jgi:hypothetical protein
MNELGGRFDFGFSFVDGLGFDFSAPEAQR